MNFMSSMNRGKRGQEEIVGFLLIVLIVIVMGVVFLFMFKTKTVETQDTQVENLLSAMMGTTVNGKTIGERVENCEKGEGCDALGSDLKNLTDVVFKKMGYSLGRNIKGYNLTITEGMTYSDGGGNATIKSVAFATKVGMSSWAKLKFYY